MTAQPGCAALLKTNGTRPGNAAMGAVLPRTAPDRPEPPRDRLSKLACLSRSVPEPVTPGRSR